MGTANVARDDLGLLQIALEWNVITTEQLQACLRERQVAEAAGRERSFARLLLEMGLVDESTLAWLRREQALRTGTGVRIGRYEIRGVLGEGAMGRVYRGWDTELGRHVAIKMVRDPVTRGSSIRRRLEREARAAARLKHPNIVTLHDVGELDGRAYLVFEFVEGEPLSAVLPARHRDLTWMLRLLEKVARALHHAHEHGVIHRDVKPANILVTPEGEPKVADFGLARLSESESALTASGAVIGTPVYMAPEQVEGRRERMGPRTDVYGLGAVLYEAVTGRPPHTGETPMEVFTNIISDDPEPARRRNPRIGADLDTVVMKCLQKSPRQRYATAEALAEDLRRVLADEPVLARPPSLCERALRIVARHRWLVAAAVVLIAAAAAVGQFVRARGLERRSERAEDVAWREQTIRRFEGVLREAWTFVYVRNVDIRAKLDDVERAVRELDVIATQLGTEGEMWALLGLGWYLVGDDQRAERALARSEACGWQDPRLNFLLGRLYLDRAVAMPVMSDPDDEWRARSRAWAEKALGYLRRPVRGWGTRDGLERDVAEVYVLLLEERAEQVETRCREGLERFHGAPGVEDYCLLRGLAAEGKARLEAYTSAIELRPHWWWAHFLRAGARPADDLVGKRADLTEAVRLNPYAAAALYDRGTVRVAQRDLDGAIGDFTEALRLKPDFAAAFSNRGAAREDKGDNAGALADYGDAIRVDTRWVIAYRNRGELRLKAGDVDGALADFEEAIRLKPESARAFNGRGRARQARRELDGAMEDYTKAIELGPDLYQPRFNRGMLRYLRRDFAAAEEDLSRALEKNSRLAHAHNYRGAARYELGRFDEAIADYGEAIRLASDYPEPLANRAMALEARGEFAAAAEDCARALAVAPPQWRHRGEVERSLESLRRRLK